MPVIDADAHVIETPATWAHLSEAERQFEPMVVRHVSGGDPRNARGEAEREYWIIDNRLMPKEFNVGVETPVESREMRDVQARLDHMDVLGIDIQVLYPTIFLRPVTAGAAVQAALYGAYNRWLAEIWRAAPERLRWVAMPPLLSMHLVRDELARARDNGAVGIFMAGLEFDRPLSDPYFFPLYETAVEMDLPICVHSATNSMTSYGLYHNDPGFNRFKLPTVGTLHSLLWNEVPARFPGLRWGFVEITSQWIPYLLNDLSLRYAKRDRDFPADMLARNNIYVACQVTDDLDWVVRYAGEDNLMVGTDYGHHDTATEIEAIAKLRADTRIAPHVIDKILDANPSALYGLG